MTESHFADPIPGPIHIVNGPVNSVPDGAVPGDYILEIPSLILMKVVE